MTEEIGPSRTTAIEEIRAMAAHHRERAKDFGRSAARLESLAKQLEAINAYADSQSVDGAESSAPSIGVGSDAEHALWQIVIQGSGD